MLVALGFFLGGPANLISTAISADLGTHPSLSGNVAALSTVTGIIDGSGSVGAAMMQYIVGVVANCHVKPSHDGEEKEECAWAPVFVLLQVGTVAACLCLVPLFYNEIKSIRRYDRP